MMFDSRGLFPAITVLVAFILTILCLFAGTRTDFLGDADILTLYTPEGSTDSVAHDFYSVHVMSYCQGTLGAANLTTGVTHNVTKCSNRTILFSFDPTQAWPKEITDGAGLEWPRVISDDFHAFRVTSQSMAILYCIGVGAMGAVLLVRAWTILAPQAAQGLFEFGFLMLGTLSTSIASIIATVLAFEFVALINAHGKGSNVSAQYGEKFLGMTWAATGLLLVGSVACFVNVFVHGQAASPVPAEKDIEG
ncbi:Actin cortical patch SUR7/pH-response regulator PalI [Penicillium paradoxum]|uniref:Actin cortical patch SUR7/pH-response regulator PalI n=1 Tax=Penicillium paradoxum TaxID=176176 RepID=UPI002548EFC9|nr:Actin cortical patch SUR7/pH-response regulator PalI [Penicillium paradoxum]KAJ5787551.1 Actin cortical patch SUR7/pH-response regulator PalI [Penicillium paradoxum]